MHAHKIAVGPPQAQEMSTTLLVANSSNMPSGSVPVKSITVGTLHNHPHEASHSDVERFCLLLTTAADSTETCRPERSRWGQASLRPWTQSTYSIGESSSSNSSAPGERLAVGAA